MTARNTTWKPSAEMMEAIDGRLACYIRDQESQVERLTATLVKHNAYSLRLRALLKDVVVRLRHLGKNKIAVEAHCTTLATLLEEVTK